MNKIVLISLALTLVASDLVGQRTRRRNRDAGPTELANFDFRRVTFEAPSLDMADIIDFEYGPANGFWHTPRDVPENTNAQTLFMVGDVVAEVVYRNR